MSVTAAPPRPMVFGGPSLSLVPAELLTGFELRPPVKRGELAALQSEAPRTVLVVDGLFGGSMAVTPLECRQLLSLGWQLLGCSSIGALRASELWSAGMIGVGTVYQLLRLEKIPADADVAVSYSAGSWQELGVSVVQVRAIVARLTSPHPAAQLVQAARRIHWLERSWADVFKAWSLLGVDAETLAKAKAMSANEALHPKKTDALEAIRLLCAEQWVFPPKE